MIHSNITLILTLSFLIWGSPFISKMVRLPIPPVEIALGSIFAYVGFITSNQYFNIIAEIGFLYLMFLAGMEVDLKQISRSSKTVIQKSILFIFLMSFFAVSMGMMFRLNMITIISMPLISIGLLASLAKNYGKEESWLKMAFIAGILGEIISIAALTVLDAASTSGFGTELLIKVGYLIMFICGCLSHI